MVVYVEYAFLQNFLFDGALLYLSLKGARSIIKKGRLILSAALGGVFAVVFPLLRISAVLAFLLKTAVAFLLCMIVTPPLKSKRDWGRYALTVFFFFVFTFGCGGALTAAFSDFCKGCAPYALVFVGFGVCFFIGGYGMKRLYKKRLIQRCIYDFAVYVDGKRQIVRGFLDTGNVSFKNDLPVCFVTPDLFYDMFGVRLMTLEKREELVVRTLGGEKRSVLEKGELALLDKKESKRQVVYFSPMANMLSREYKMIVGASVMDGEEIWR